MEQMQVEEKKMSAANRPLLIVLLSVVLLLTLSVALTSVLVHRSQTSQLRAVKEPTLKERFPGYFRYPEEQEAFEKLDRPSTPVTSFPNVTLSSVSKQCSALLSHPDVLILSAGTTEHNACCRTTATFTSPEYLKDILGVNRRIAVFKHQSGAEAKQFIRQESCTQSNECDFCRCSVKTAYATLVWMSGSEYGVSWFAVDGCCKCFNS